MERGNQLKGRVSEFLYPLEGNQRGATLSPSPTANLVGIEGRLSRQHFLK
jgi:hypothetical protein